MRYSDLLKQWKSKNINTVDELDTALNNFRILFAYNSNVIENPQTTYHDTREIFENGKVINYTGDLRTIFEIKNQKECYDYLRDLIIEKHPLDKELILAVHKKLMRGCYDETRYGKGEIPGEYKKHDYITGDNVGSDPQYVEDDINKLCDEMNNVKGDNLIKAAYFHLNFESIHPFADGNGRVGRTLMNYYLMTNDYPPTIIYNEDKDTYYMGLTVFDKTGDITGFKKFIEEESVKTWEKRTIKKKSLEQYVKPEANNKSKDDLER